MVMSVWMRACLALAAALLFLCGAWLCNWRSVIMLERELLETRRELENMGIDHRDTMDAITNALDAREAIHEQAKKQEQRLRRELEADPLADAPVPDSWRLRLRWGADGEIPAPGKPPQPDANPGSGANRDGGRHGADNP